MKYLFQAILLTIFLTFILSSEEVIQKNNPQSYDEPFSFSEWDIEEHVDLKHPQLNNHPEKDHFDISQLEPVLSAECEPLTTVANCVNVVSGHFFQIEKDITSNTVEPLEIIRFYDSGNVSESMIGFGFGSQFPLWASDIQEGTRHHYGMISERENFMIPYKGRTGTDHQGQKNCEIDPRVMQKGYTNLSRAVVNGNANFINWQALFKPKGNSRESAWNVSLGDGSQRIYGRQIKLDKEQRHRMNFPTSKAYLLTEEIKANGNKLQYIYQQVQDKIYLEKITALNRSEKPTILDELNFSFSSQGCTVTSLCQGSLEYFLGEESTLSRHVCFEKESYRNVLKKVQSSTNGDTTLETLKQYGNRKIVKINKPEGRFIEVCYDEASTRREDDKVKTIIEPCGQDNKPIETYRFHYGKKFTTVWDAIGQRTDYHFDDYKRLSHIDYFDSKTVIRQDAFVWSKESGQEGWLKRKAVKCGNDFYYLKSFRYDKQGNIERETLYGNITGEKPETFTIDQKDSTDSYITCYRYSNDSFNLLLEKTTPEGLKISYAYLPGTNLCILELHTYDGKIQERFFRHYDDNGQIQKTIEDDGSSELELDLNEASFRKVITVDSVATPKVACFGKPQKQMTSYWDDTLKEMKVLNCIEFEYDDQGNETIQRHYNSKNILCFEVIKTYDKRNRLITSCNAVGEMTVYRYDENGNIRKKTIKKSDKSTSYSYDHANRLKAKHENHQNGEVFTTTYLYNGLDQLVSEIDPYGHATTYGYNRFGKEILCEKPVVQDVNGFSIQPKVVKKYNILNQLIEKTDENGFKTLYSNNVYGSPTQIIHPCETDETNPAIERFIYYPKGWLKQHWQTDGSSICYEYNPKGKLTKKAFLDDKGIFLKEEKYEYKGALLQHKIDAMGIKTTYKYDWAGRKISECIDNRRTTHFVYDDFDRLIKTIRPLNSAEGQCETYEYDGLNRMISKELQDLQENVYSKETYQYDIQGNKSLRNVCHTLDKKATYRSHYNSDGTLQWEENPLKQRTTWEYNHHHKNGLNQRVQCRKATDPLGRPMHEADDAHGRLVRRDLILADQILACTHYDYDAVGRLVRQESQVRSNGDHFRNYAAFWKYHCRGWKKAEIELPDNKTTQFDYDKRGRLIKKTKPDGVFMTYTYDALGRLFEKKSSDGTVAYTYWYDLHDNIKEIKDSVHNITQKRTYDNLDRLEKEEFSSDTHLTYTYDALDRLTRLDFPDGSSIVYTYDTFHLKQMERYNSHQKLIYHCECPEHDLQGRLLKSISPAGTIDYTYDLLGRTQRIDSPNWHSCLEDIDAVGNLRQMKQEDPEGEFSGQFSYDRFNHLADEKIEKEEHHYDYDSIGNCLTKNGESQTINTLNQLREDGSSTYEYDLNGNLLTQSNPSTTYTYDALNRLIHINQNGRETDLVYDAFDRLIQIKDGQGTKQLLYQGMREIGSFSNGKMKEFRLMHPNPESELTFAIELEETPYFPVQDYRYNICALQTDQGSLAQWYRYTSFGLKTVFGSNSEELFNPWRFANKREIEGLSLFPHRFYHPQIRRWLTKDPLGFEDGLHLYAYVHNNPHYYTDPDGRLALALPVIVTLVEFSFGAGAVATAPVWLPALGASVATALIAYSCYELAIYAGNQLEDVAELEQEKKKKPGDVYAPDRPLPLDDKHKRPVPDALAEGGHTQLGTKEGRKRKYPQAREFDAYGKPVKDIDFTDHGYPKNHPNPHQHTWKPNETGGTPKRGDKIAEPVPYWNY